LEKGEGHLLNGRMEEWKNGMMDTKSYELRVTSKIVPQCCCNAVRQFKNKKQENLWKKL
jgi:hypothetical protein